MMASPSLDERIKSLAADVDAVYREYLADELRTLRTSGNSAIVLTGMSRVATHLVRHIIESAGHKPRSDNLDSLIQQASKRDEENKTPGLGLIPKEIATWLHPVRVTS